MSSTVLIVYLSCKCINF